MPDRSTQTNLLELTQFLHERTKAGDAVDILYFDFTKAFDQVDHGLLASKLVAMSLPCTFFTVVLNFITNRCYKLEANRREYEQIIEASSSVPQGSHCGPILYLLMTADIIHCVRDVGVQESMYADDTKFISVVNNITQMNELQTAVDRLSKWSIDNKIKLNVNKTYHVTYIYQEEWQQSHYYLGIQIIKKVTSTKDLGVTFDQHLTFETHIDNMLRSAVRIFGMARRFAYEIHSPRTILKLLHVYVVPLIEYCPIVWHQEKTTHITKLEAYLHKATRIALGSAYRPNQPGYLYYEQRIRSLQILTLQQRRVFAIIIAVIKILRGAIMHWCHADTSTFHERPNQYKITKNIQCSKCGNSSKGYSASNSDASSKYIP